MKKAKGRSGHRRRGPGPSRGPSSRGTGVQLTQDVRVASDAVCVVEQPRMCAVRRSHELLAERYESATLDIDDGMMEDGLQPTVENMEVKIAMLSRPDLRNEFREQGFDSGGDMWRVEHVFSRAAESLENVTLESLFEDVPTEVVQNGRTYRVVVISSAGCGKTTVFTKVAPLHWARGELWAGLFDLVVARELRCEDVRLAKGAHDLLGLDSLLLSDAERQDVLKFLHHHPERLCLVLDGLDETSLSRCSSFVQSVIRGEQMRGIRLVLTSRPSGDIFKLTDGKKLDRKVELIGFHPEDVEMYVRRILNSEEASQLLQKMKENPHLPTMMCTPILAFEICKLYHWRKQVPNCVADIFELLILRLASHRSEFQYDSWNEVPEGVRQPILNLGCFAFRMLQDQCLVFNESELLPYGEAISLGLLVACDRSPGDHVKQWRFSHLTLQESLAAKYVTCSGTMSCGKIVQLVEYFGPDAGHMRTFWMLLAVQLENSCLETLLNSLLTRKKVKHAVLPKVGASAIAMSQFPLKYHPVLCEMLSRSSMNRLAEILLAMVVSGSGVQYVENRMSRVHIPRDDDFLQSLLLTWVEQRPVADDAMLIEAVSKIDCGVAQLCREVTEGESKAGTPSMWILPVPHSTSTDCYGTTRDHPRLDLVYRCYAECALHHGDDIEPSRTITSIMPHESGSTRLNFFFAGSQDLQTSARRAKTTVLQHHQHVFQSQGLQLCWFNCDSPCKVPLRPDQYNQLDKLMFWTCTFGEHDDHGLFAILDSLSPSLVQVMFKACEFHPTGMKRLAQIIAASPKLAKLSFQECPLSTDVVEPLVIALPRVSSLTELSLNRSLTERYGDGAMQLLCSAVSQCTGLKRLDLSWCEFSAHALQLIATCLPNWHLEEFLLARCKSVYTTGNCCEESLRIAMATQRCLQGRRAEDVH